MPVTVLSAQTADEGVNDKSFNVFDEQGGLTLLGSVVVEFLERADFSALFEHPEAAAFIYPAIDEDGNEAECMPSSVAADLVDEDDFAETFGLYVERFVENVDETSPLEMRAQAASLKPVLEAYKRGSFRRMRKAEGGAQGRDSTVNMMLGAMKAKGEIKRVKPGTGYKGGDYAKAGRYGKGPTKAAKTKGKQVAKRNMAKNKRAKASTSRRAASRVGRQLAASIGMEEGLLFGQAVPYGGMMFSIAPDYDRTVTMTDEALDDVIKSYGEFYEDEQLDEMRKRKGKGAKGRFGKAKPAADDEEGDDMEESDQSDLTGIGSHLEHVTGPREVSEGAGMAARALGRMGALGKPLNG